MGNTHGMRWAAATNLDFKIPGGYFLAPRNGNTGDPGRFGGRPSGIGQLLDEVATTGRTTKLDERQRRPRAWTSCGTASAACWCCRCASSNAEPLRRTVEQLSGRAAGTSTCGSGTSGRCPAGEGHGPGAGRHRTARRDGRRGGDGCPQRRRSVARARRHHALPSSPPPRTGRDLARRRVPAGRAGRRRWPWRTDALVVGVYLLAAFFVTGGSGCTGTGWSTWTTTRCCSSGCWRGPRGP